jgi:hypothetical protein
MENWTTLNINPDYEISDLGNIRHKKLKQNKKLITSRSGASMIVLRIAPNKYKTFPYSVLMKQLMPPKPSPKHQLCHLNGIRSDYRLSNLQWMLQSDLMLHGIKLGKRVYPPNPRDTKFLTKKEMKNILNMHHKGYTHVKIGKILRRNNSTISKFLKREREKGTI